MNPGSQHCSQNNFPGPGTQTPLQQGWVGGCCGGAWAKFIVKMHKKCLLGQTLVNDPWFGGKEETKDMTLTHNLTTTSGRERWCDGAVGLPLFLTNI